MPVPRATLIARSATSYPLGAADTMQQPVHLDTYGYVEEEYAVTGTAQVYDWNADGTLTIRQRGLRYTTRVIVRRPSDPAKFSGTVLVDVGNRGAGFDTFAAWGQLSEHLLRRGHAYVGVTVFAGNIGALQLFDKTRYAALAFPPLAERCGANHADTWNRPADNFPPSEDAIRWDVISQVGSLIKSATGGALPGFRVERVYASMQSGGDLPTYIIAFSRNLRLANDTPVYDAFLIKDSGGPRLPLNDCAKPLGDGDPRRTIRNAGVPVVQILTQNSVSAATRRPDSDVSGDQFRLYEIPGSSHFDRWQYNYPRVEDLAKAGVPPLTDHWVFPSECAPSHVAPNEFPLPLLFAGAFANLDEWVKRGTPPPTAPRIEMNGDTLVNDEYGNARGGVRTPWVDVPVATFHPEMTGRSSTPFRCDDNGYWTPLPWAHLEQAYGSTSAYRDKFRVAVDRLVAGRWITKEDANQFKERSTW